MYGLYLVQRLSVLPVHGMEAICKTRAHDADCTACVNSMMKDFVVFQYLKGSYTKDGDRHFREPVVIEQGVIVLK